MGTFFVHADQIDAAPVTWLWPGRIPRGALTLVEGDPASGKSTLLTDVAARETQGLMMPGSDIPGTGGGVIWISDEDAPATLLRNLQVSGAALNKILIYDKRAAGRFILPAGVELLEQTIVDNSCTLAIVDPITSFLDGSTNAENVVRAAVSPLTAVAERTGAAVVLNRHLRKGGSGSVLYRGIGSIGLVAAARSALLVGKEPGADAELAKNPLRVVAHFKSSLGLLSESLAFRIIPEGQGVRVEWVGTSRFTAEQLLTATGTGEASALAEACHVLYSLLGEGPLWANEVKQLAGRSGVAAKTLQRAKLLLGVPSLRHGFGKGARYYWALPDESELIARLKEKDLSDLADALVNGRPERPADPPPDGRTNRRTPWGSGDLYDDEDDDPSDWWKRG